MEISIPEIVHDQIMHWVNKANYEVSGFGKCQWNKETKTIEVLSAHLLKQEGGPSVTDIDATSLSKLMYTTRQKPGELRFWWHSHVKMPAFWSSTDTDTIHQLGSNGWCCAIVFNQKYEYKAAYCGKIQTALGETTTQLVDDLDMTIIYPERNTDIIKSWDVEFDANVTEKKYTYSSSVSSFPSLIGDPAWDQGEGNVLDMTKDNRNVIDDAAWEESWARTEARRRSEELDPAIQLEAAACGMGYHDYIDALTEQDPDTLTKIDNKLCAYWNSKDRGLVHESLKRAKDVKSGTTK